MVNMYHIDVADLDGRRSSSSRGRKCRPIRGIGSPPSYSRVVLGGRCFDNLQNIGLRLVGSVLETSMRLFQPEQQMKVYRRGFP